MKDALSKTEVTAILHALEKAIAEGPWEASTFLKVVGKNLRDIRGRFLVEMGVSESETSHVLEKEAFAKDSPSDYQEVYVALYSSNGARLMAWEKILDNLERQIISRPVYASEKDVSDFIKMRDSKGNDAYVAILVQSQDILSTTVEKTALDKLGKPLLVLKDRAIVLKNIQRFVHMSGVYRYQKGKLITF